MSSLCTFVQSFVNFIEWYFASDPLDPWTIPLLSLIVCLKSNETHCMQDWAEKPNRGPLFIQLSSSSWVLFYLFDGDIFAYFNSNTMRRCDICIVVKPDLKREWLIRATYWIETWSNYGVRWSSRPALQPLNPCHLKQIFNDFKRSSDVYTRSSRSQRVGFRTNEHNSWAYGQLKSFAKIRRVSGSPR